MAQISFLGRTNSGNAPAGAALVATWSVLVSDNDLTLTASSLPPEQFGYFLSSPVQGFIANPGGSDGNLCLGGGALLGRYAGMVQNSGPGGDPPVGSDANQPSGPVAPRLR